MSYLDLAQSAALSGAVFTFPMRYTFDNIRSNKSRMWSCLNNIAHHVLPGYYLNALLSSTFPQHKYTPIIKKGVLAVVVARVCFIVWREWSRKAVDTEADYKDRDLLLALLMGIWGCQVYRLRDPDTRVSAVVASAITLLGAYGGRKYAEWDYSIIFRMNDGRWGITYLRISVSWVALGVITGYKCFKRL